MYLGKYLKSIPKKSINTNGSTPLLNQSNNKI